MAVYGANTHKGRYTPKNPAKYRGDYRNIIYRSGWELKAFNWCDTRTSVVQWSSEEVIVPYISPLDGRYHRYFVDLLFVIDDGKGNRTVYLAEIKPEKFTRAPAKPKRQTKKYLEEVMQWGVNSAKWAAAQEYCLDRGWKFIILTEKHLGIKK